MSMKFSAVALVTLAAAANAVASDRWSGPNGTELEFVNVDAKDAAQVSCATDAVTSLGEYLGSEAGKTSVERLQKLGVKRVRVDLQKSRWQFYLPTDPAKISGDTLIVRPNFIRIGSYPRCENPSAQSVINSISRREDQVATARAANPPMPTEAERERGAKKVLQSLTAVEESADPKSVASAVSLPLISADLPSGETDTH